jgi:ATP-dependent protease ClpP protease subunit
MTGDILPGDAERFRRFMLANLKRFQDSSRTVVLSSNGGDVVEALKIHKILKAMYVNIYAYRRGGEHKCASACFFIYLAGVYRFAAAGDLGIHRAYFDPSVTSELSVRDAEKRQEELRAMVAKILSEDAVPQNLIERMNRTSSSEIYWLSREEIDSIGVRPAWYEEALMARCGLDKHLENEMLYTDANSPRWNVLAPQYKRNLMRVSLCEKAFVAPEISRLKGMLQPPVPAKRDPRRSAVSKRRR